jgi:hypothetical protein
LNKYKHSGTTGDLIYSLPIVQHFGGGEFYLHMDQIDYLSRHFYGVESPAFHQGRMNNKDYEFIKSFMEAQTYITKFAQLNPSVDEITHNLDKFRPLFIQHPGNYVDVYATAFGISDPSVHTELRNNAWLTVPEVKTVEGKSVAVNRTARWIPPQLSPIWSEWTLQGIEDKAFFLGLPEEYEAFKRATGWDIPYQPTTSLLEVAEYIAGADAFIGNQSVALSVAIGLGHPEIWCEARRDLPIERNECYFKEHPGIHYF